MKIKNLLYLFRHLGARWLAYRCYYAFAHKLRLFERRMPVCRWNEIPDYEENPAALTFIPAEFNQEQRERFVAWDKQAGSESVIAEAEAVLRGEFVLFGYHHKPLGKMPDWHQNAMTGETCDKKLHWSRIADFGHGDIKCVWEINRFPWAFALARAYARTGDERFAERFWLIFENWLEEHPPNQGVNWKCGQEATFRMLAVAFARGVFARARSTTEARLTSWRRFAAFTARRIAGNLAYALSQNNNHGISECVGLITAVRLLPGLPGASNYLAGATASLIGQLASLVYSDGGFSQHSTVYHRVVMHDLIWYLALEKAVGQKPDARITAAAERALRFMAGITDLETGLAPLHGPNDGANVLPLSSNDFLDFRPVLTAMAALTGNALPVAAGPHDETLFWLSLTVCEKQGRSGSAKNFFAEQSGWNIISGENSRLFCYAPCRFRHRPAQADLLHVDLWWRGLPLTRDPGSFSYNTQGQFASMLNSTEVHNTVSVDGCDQMHKVSRFLYLPWPESRSEWRASESLLAAAHNGYRDRGIIHTRQIRKLAGDEWHVEDNLASSARCSSPHEFRLHWLLADYPFTLIPDDRSVILHTPAGDYVVRIMSDAAVSRFDLVRADKDSERGWWSPYYYQAEPALSLAVSFSSVCEVKVTTILAPA